MNSRYEIQALLNYIYGVLFVLYTFFSILILFSNFNVQSAEMVMLYRIIKIFIMLLLIPIIVLRPYKLKVRLLMSISILIALYGYYVNSQDRILMFLLFAFASRGVNPKKVLQVDFVIRVFTFVTVIFLYGIGILQNSYFLRSNGALREALGFGHPNYGGIILFSIILEWALLRDKKISFLECFSMLGISYFFYKYFLARTDWVLTIIFVALVIINKFLSRKWLMRFSKVYLLPFWGWILTIFSFAILMFVNQGSSLYLALNELLSSRLDIFQFYYKASGISLLPKNINVYFQDSTFVGMDNAFIFVGLFDGVLLLIIFCIVEQVIGNNLKYFSNNVKLVFLFIMLIGLTEALIVYPFINILVIYFGRSSYKDGQRNIKPVMNIGEK